MHPHAWLLAAGYGTWLVASLPTLAGLSGGRTGAAETAAALSAFLAFGLAFTLNARPRRPGAAPPVVLLAVQAASALALVALGRDGLAGAMLVVVAGQLVGPLSPGAALAWVVTQSAALVAVLTAVSSPEAALPLGGAFLGFQLFALATSALTQSERHAREALAVSHAELQATRAKLIEQSRLEERLRISRDLHDTMGHHLTALSLQLEVASRLGGGEAAGHVRQAHAITRLLLSDVRDVVSRLRDRGGPTLAQALREMARAHAGLTVHLEVPDTLAAGDEARTDTLRRCVQEIMTNTARHAGARNLWITLAAGDTAVTLDARDDGRGGDRVRPGHGLTGLNERFAQFGGHIEFTTAPGQGFALRGVMPHGGTP